MCVDDTRPLRLRQRHWKLMKGGMNSHDVDEKDQKKKKKKNVYLAYI